MFSLFLTIRSQNVYKIHVYETWCIGDILIQKLKSGVVLFLLSNILNAAFSQEQWKPQRDVFSQRCVETTMDFNYENNGLSSSCRWGKGWVIFRGPESISLWRKHCITYLIPANYTQAQSLIEAVDIEQPAVVIYFFTILPGKPSQTSVKQRSVSSKSIHPEPWALTSLL